MTYWTVPFDDHLLKRWGRGCLLCASAEVDWAWTRVIHGLAVGISLCERCHRQDLEHQQVDALLRARYAPGPLSRCGTSPASPTSALTTSIGGRDAVLTPRPSPWHS